MASFFSTSHINFKYGSYWINLNSTKLLDFSPVILPYDKEIILANKTKTIFWTVSNCRTSSKREVAIHALRKFN